MTDRAERRALALALYEAAVAAADPAQVVLEGLAAHAATLEPLATRPHWIISVGKAAPAMAEAARAWCADERRPLAGGLVIGADPDVGDRVEPMHHLAGDHPI
ncbi:MAG: DUF4147 domain-containing protein, partial [Gemmatimonadota bacterium]